jgi:hypothetical protein
MRDIRTSFLYAEKRRDMLDRRHDDIKPVATSSPRLRFIAAI